MTGPAGGDGALTSHESIVSASRDAVAAAVAANAAQQGQAERWMTSGFPADAAAHTPGARQHD